MGLMKKHQQRHQEAKVLGAMPGAAAAPQNSGAGMAGAPGNSGPAFPKGRIADQQLATFCDAALQTDLQALKDVPSHERRAEIKRNTLVPKYRLYVERLLVMGGPHELLGWFLVWLFDALLIEEAVAFGLKCVEKGQKLPEAFSASTPFFIAEKLLEWAEGEYRANRAFEPYLSQVLAQMLESPQAWPVPDKLVAGFYRLLGLKAEQDGNLVVAQAHLNRAYELGAAVKTALDGVQKRLAKTAAFAPALEIPVNAEAAAPEGASCEGCAAPDCPDASPTAAAPADCPAACPDAGAGE